MGHEDLSALHFQVLVQGVFAADVLPVAVAAHAHQRLERRNGVGERQAAAEVAGVPYHVHRLQEFAEAVGEDTVGVADEADKHFRLF